MCAIANEFKLENPRFLSLQATIEYASSCQRRVNGEPPDYMDPLRTYQASAYIYIDNGITEIYNGYVDFHAFQLTFETKICI